MLAFAILDPHPRMNVALTRREAQDVAAYINTLVDLPTFGYSGCGFGCYCRGGSCLAAYPRRHQQSLCGMYGPVRGRYVSDGGLHQ